jgi:hypothetical protein
VYLCHGVPDAVSALSQFDLMNTIRFIIFSFLFSCTKLLCVSKKKKNLQLPVALTVLFEKSIVLPLFLR